MNLIDRGKKASIPLARLLTCMYIAALLFGPAPWGWNYGVLQFLSPIMRSAPRPLHMIAIFAIQYVIPAGVAGFLAGRRLGVFVGLLGIMLTQGYHYQVFLHSIGQSKLVLASIVTLARFYGPGLFIVPTLFGWLGGRLSLRLKAGQVLDGWRHWPKLGVIAALLLIYAFTFGKTVAFHTLHSKFANIWPADAKKIRVWSAGVYPAVDGITGCKGCGFPDTYYTDPTGLVFLYKRNLD